jgi:hypothetical protein
MPTDECLDVQVGSEEPSVAVAQAHAAPHWHSEPQEQTGFVAGVWHPQAQAVPGQVVQVQRFWFTSLMMKFLGWLDDGRSSMQQSSA